MSRSIVVLIVAHGRPDLLDRTLGSLAQCKLPQRFAGTLVVENGHQCGVEAVARHAHPKLDCRYMFEPTPSKCAALNRALVTLNDELVVFFDDDVRLTQGILCEYADASTGIDGGLYFGGPTGCDYELEPANWLKRFLPPSAKGHAIEDGERDIRHPTLLLGFNWAAFADDMRACGGFHTGFGPGGRVSVGDESIMQYELNRRGVVGRYIHQAMVWHYVPVDRCSAQWLLRRAYPNGFAAGTFAAHYSDERKQRLGMIRSLRKVMIKEWRRIGNKSLLTFDQAARLGVRVSAAYIRGFIAGFQFTKTKRPLDPRQPIGRAKLCELAEACAVTHAT